VETTSVSKFELLRELTATQGVVERKTTIAILSNPFSSALKQLSDGIAPTFAGTGDCSRKWEGPLAERGFQKGFGN
jgi:hypothetical protein